jgi:hypothetical protein
MLIISEPLIRFTEPPLMLVNALVLNGVVFLGFFGLSLIWPIGSPLLLVGILLSASVLLALQAMRMRAAYVALLVLQSALFIGLMLKRLPLVQVMELSATIPAMLGILYLFTQGAKLPSIAALKQTLGAVMRQIPQLISMTAVMNLLLSALPVFLAPVLSARDLGMFKVATSVIQAATTLFPISTQALLSGFVAHPRGAEFYRLLTNLSLIYFALGMLLLVALALVAPVLAPYLMLAPLLPVFFYAILAERHLTARHQSRPLILINLTLTGLLLLLFAAGLVSDLRAALLYYATGLTLYALVLLLLERSRVQNLPLLITFAACPLVIERMGVAPWLGLAYGALVLVVSLARKRPTKRQVMLLWKEM